jgi:hypothetical protein
MASEISITRCIEALKGGDHDAAQRIWEAYFHRLVGLARARLLDAPRRAADEEDVALSAFDSFCRGVDAGRFPRLDDRHDLWQVLVLITVRKAIDLRQHEGRQVRGGERSRPSRTWRTRASTRRRPASRAPRWRPRWSTSTAA